MHALLRAAAALTLSAVAAAALPACPGPEPEGTDLFRVAIDGAPGGSLLSVWGPRGRSGPNYLAGGFVGLDVARLAGTGMSAGRLVEYDTGRFTTRCRADAVLWWVHGLDRDGATREVWAAGEAGTVLRYRDGRCEVLPLGITFPEGPVTFWGLWASAPDDVLLVGGSARPDGPRGVIVRWDGARFTRLTDLPAEARDDNLYKITRVGARYLVVGSGGTILAGDGRGPFTAVASNLTSSDNRLFTVHCADPLCVAVGGVATGRVRVSPLGATGGAFVSLFSGEDDGRFPGLNGVHVQDASNVFVVGANGFTMHVAFVNGVGVEPRSWVGNARTPATLHGVGGDAARVLAVGGELDERTPSQRGVVLVRGDGSERFTFDGRSYEAQGTLRRSLGGAGQ